MIKDLKNSMETVDECSKDNLLQVKLEGEKQQKEELRASQAKCARLQQDIQQLEEQLNKLILEHRVSELALRKVNGQNCCRAAWCGCKCLFCSYHFLAGCTRCLSEYTCAVLVLC